MSIPTLAEFDPRKIPYQIKVVRDIRRNFEYNKTHEILLSGSVGSAKSILVAHLAVTHCLQNRNALALLGRRSMPHLKDTLLQMCIDHIGDDLEYKHNEQKGSIYFPQTGSKIISHSWADKKYKKVRSYALSFAAIEELTENDDLEFYKEIRMRLNRRPEIKEKIIICATNPDSPRHPAYEYFIQGSKKKDNRHVYYSRTEDNPFLPSSYIEELRESLTERECLRMIEGQWIEIAAESIYYAYDPDESIIENYVVDENYPILIGFDFNIADGKPFSCVLAQRKGHKYYVFDEIVVHGMRTLDAFDEMVARGHLNHQAYYIIHGDCDGRKRSTQYNRSDYDEIEKAFSNYVSPSGRLGFEIDVPTYNPAVRSRHILMNGLLKNANGETKIFLVRDKCPTLDKGLRLTRLKKGAQYVENDNDPWQHCTTSLGYLVCSQEEQKKMGQQFVKRKLY